MYFGVSAPPFLCFMAFLRPVGQEWPPLLCGYCFPASLSFADGVAMEPSAFGPTRTFTLFKDSQLTRRARWELGQAREQEGTLGESIGQTPGGTWTPGI